MREALFEIYTWIPLSLHNFMRNKQVEFTPYIYTLTTCDITLDEEQGHTHLNVKISFWNPKLNHKTRRISSRRISKIVKRLRRRQYDPLIIERTIGLVLGPSTASYGPFLKHCTLTNKAVGTIWRTLSKPPQRRQDPDLRPLWLLVGTPSAIRPELAFSRAEHSLPYSDVTIYIIAILYLFTYALRVSIFMTSPLGVAVGLLSI